MPATKTITVRAIVKFKSATEALLATCLETGPMSELGAFREKQMANAVVDVILHFRDCSFPSHFDVNASVTREALDRMQAECSKDPNGMARWRVIESIARQLL